jgi:phosphatidylserine/phosphatidylglycerophosphate/cardiolipin synthase-like enzyme/outer membrane protein OmpA-like peptidoglycan-associated protein
MMYSRTGWPDGVAIADWAAPLAGSVAEVGGGDANVRWLQSALNQLIGAGLTVDGIAGNATRNAVQAFQGRNSLTPDGIANPLTVSAIRAALATGPVPVAPPVCTGLPVRQTLHRFAFGRHNIEPHHQLQIDSIAACLLASLDTPTPIDGLALVGHTDTVGDDGANTVLGQRRAEAVAEAIDASLRRQGAGRHFSFVFTPSTRGESEPIPGDPALSRRVDVIAPFAFQPRADRPLPFRSPLDPPRWGPLLARVISPRATIRTGNAVRHLVDAENPGAPMLAGYDAMVEAIRSVRGGRAFIYLLGWICIDDFNLITCDPSTELRKLLEKAAQDGVQVRAMFWEAALHMRTQRRQTQASADHINALPGGAAIIDGETLSLGSHHQKLLVVGDGERLVGFCGGLDVNPDRILPSTIVCPTPGPSRLAQRARESFEVNFDGFYNESDAESMSGGGGNPLHDVHCRVEGPASADLLGTFITRWDHHPASRAIEARTPLRSRGLTPPASLSAPLSPQLSSTGDSCSVIIGRTFNPRRGSGMPRERDIRAMLLAGIRNARRFIYMEEQYLLNLEAARALRAALPNIQHLTIVIAATDVNSDTPCIWTLRREFVEELLRSLPPDQAAKVRIFQLVTPPIPAVPPPCTTPSRRFMPTFGRHTYVHAKCWVFDDELAVIGSANCNRRGWEHDSEINAFIFDDRVPAIQTARTFAQQMRMDLWAEHLSLPASRFVDGVASASLWLRPATTARVMRYCPDEGTDTFPPQCGILRDTLVDPAAP